MSAEVQFLLTRLFDKNIGTRITLEQIKGSSWLRGTPYTVKPVSAAPTPAPIQGKLK